MTLFALFLDDYYGRTGRITNCCDALWYAVLGRGGRFDLIVGWTNWVTPYAGEPGGVGPGPGEGGGGGTRRTVLLSVLVSVSVSLSLSVSTVRLRLRLSLRVRLLPSPPSLRPVLRGSLSCQSVTSDVFHSLLT